MSRNIQLGVSTVMAGQVMTDMTTGEHSISHDDLVLLSAHADGEQLASYQLTVAQTMDLAGALATAAGSLVSEQIDDDGKRLSLLDRLARLNGGGV